ncbi:MAG: OmpA family protein [Rhodospirillaceae bacterium]|nr:OmpA family protein [Rhodospirillaceae bacterium]
MVPSPAAARAASTEQAGPALAFGPTETEPPADTPPEQAASLPDPATGGLSEETATTLTLPFAAGVAEITGSSLADIKALAERMAGDRSLRVQLMAYASDPEKNTSRARRLALDRAVAVRNLLIDAAVERTRIEVRALGDQLDSGPPDRVDAIVVKR